MSEFKFKKYRVEWWAEVYSVDQYDRRDGHDIFYKNEFPTYDEAKANLDSVTTLEHGHYVYSKAPHSYYRCGVSYHEVLVEE